MPACPQCHTSTDPKDKFCGHCGSELSSGFHPAPTLTAHALDVTEVKYRLGIVYFKKNNRPGAVALWKEVLALNPNHQGAREMLDQVEADDQRET